MGDGLIAEVDTLVIPASRNGTSEGLTIKSGTGTAAWDCAGPMPVIRFAVGAPSTGLFWGDYPAAAGISGPAELKLLAGYAAASTGAYTVTGIPAPTVTLNSDHGGKITWDGTNKKLNIAAGLAPGEYSVTLTASNGTSPNATTTFKLTVAKTIFSTRYESNFLNWLLFFLGFGFIWMWF